ncbi:hypothetical protein GS538_20235 [Rhodococcus hoagii]|nr:hypothetical protein [Prescottella equi]
MRASTDKTTVEQWLTRWLDEIAKPRIRPRVWLTYGSAIRNNITPHIGAYKLQKLTPANVREMHRAVAKAGKSSRTAEIAHNILARSLTDAVREGILTKNVCDLVDKPKVTMKSRGNLTSEQARTLLRVSASKRDPMVARWAMALMTGARQGECLGLQWERVDFERNLIDLSWQLQRIPKRHGCGDPSPTTGLFKCGKHPRRPASCPQAVWDVEPGFEMIALDRGQLALTSRRRPSRSAWCRWSRRSPKPFAGIGRPLSRTRSISCGWGRTAARSVPARTTRRGTTRCPVPSCPTCRCTPPGTPRPRCCSKRGWTRWSLPRFSGTCRS